MTIKFKINKVEYEVDLDKYAAETTLNYFIRTSVGLHGTKFMCNEGGCGACIVTAKMYDPYSKFYRIVGINSCLKLLNTCDGIEVTTIEGLGSKHLGYHPIQSTLANTNGTQCGYCSPGMVMLMSSLMESKVPLTRGMIEKSFDGNVCRCTGYRPILDAMKSFATQGIVDIEELSTKCRKLKVCHRRDRSDDDDFEMLDDFTNTKSLCSASACSAESAKACIEYGNNIDEIVWFNPKSLDELLKLLGTLPTDSKYYLICAGTGHGVYRRPDDLKILIDLTKIDKLYMKEILGDRILIGANTSISDAIDLLKKASSSSLFEYCTEIVQHWSLVATVSVRNVAGLAGNLMLKHDHPDFPSDIFLILYTINAKIEVLDANAVSSCNTAAEFLAADMTKKVIKKIVIPSYDPCTTLFKSYKVRVRTQNSYALLNAAFLLTVLKSPTALQVLKARLCFGNVRTDFLHASDTESFIANQNLLEPNCVEKIIAKLYSEAYTDAGYGHVPQEYRRTVACSLLYKFFLSIIPSNRIAAKYLSGKDMLERPISVGSQTYSVSDDTQPVGQPVHKVEGEIQCSGEAFYSNDLPAMKDELWAAYVKATHVGSILVGIDTTAALAMPGVVAFFGAKDIMGSNSFVSTAYAPILTEDEPVFVGLKSVVRYYDQPVGILVGSDFYALHKAVKMVQLTYAEPIKGCRSTLFSIEDVKDKAELSERIVSSISKTVKTSAKGGCGGVCASQQIMSNFSMNGQYHFTMEPQTTVCFPTENGITLYSATQYIDLLHVVLQNFLALPQKDIYIEVVRLGGAYGSKFSRSAQIACAAALACTKLNRPIRFVLPIEDMMRTIGKRQPVNCEYTVKVDGSNGKIGDLSIEFFVNQGWNGNENMIIPYCLPAITNCYTQFESWHLDGNSVTTDAAKNTPCRAPGSFEGIAMIETVMENIAFELGLDAVDVRMANIQSDNKMKMLLPKFVQVIDYRNRKQQIEQFNSENRWMKKGIAISVMEFGLIFYGPQQVYITIYHGDGSVNITHSGIEMGQGLNTKVLQVAAYALGVPMSSVSFKPTNSFVTANSSFSAGSYTSETACMAVKKACDIINARLKPVRDSLQGTNPTWVDVIHKAFAQNIELKALGSASAEDFTPYKIFGLACSEVLIDVLTGTTQVTRVDITEDTGISLSPLIDVGQIEGAFMMGLGLWLKEKLIYDKMTGELLTDTTFSYKVPLATDIPINFNINLIQNNPNPVGFLRSKTTGEPATCLAISAVFAIRHALNSARKDAGITEWCKLGAPTTCEEVLLNSGTDYTQFRLN